MIDLIDQVRLGFKLFVRDMKESVPLSVTFVIAVLAFALAFAVATGLHF